MAKQANTNLAVRLPRRERDRQLREEDFLVAGERLFSLQGFSGTSMEAIAREADYATGTIYRYFDSKEDLYAKLLLRKLEGYFDYLRTELAGAQDAREYVDRLIHLKLHYFEQEKSFLRIYVKEMLKDPRFFSSGLDAEAREFHDLELARMEQELSVLLGHQVPPHRARMLLRAIMGITQELLLDHFTLDRDQTETMEEIETFIRELIFRGMGDV